MTFHEAKRPKLKPAQIQPLLKDAAALHQGGQLTQAQLLYDHLLDAVPRHPQALHGRGLIAAQQGDFERAAELIGRALAASPGEPAYLANRGIAWRELGRLEDGLRDFDQSLRLRPRHADTWSNRGITLKRLGQLGPAAESFDKALLADPGHASARMNRGMLRLLEGNFQQGWPDYEARWQTTGRSLRAAGFGAPAWSGREALGGRTVLLHAEQGLGDTLQFCRFAQAVRARGARVVLEAQAALVPLLKDLPGVDVLHPAGQPRPSFDAHCPLMSLPLALGTEATSIPLAQGYLAVDPARVEAWAAALGERRGLRVGLVWSGNPGHDQDHRRSLPLADWLPHLPPGLDLVSLQKEVAAGDAAALASRPDIRHLGSRLQDFADTAALCQLVDVVLSVDTSVAHLAGALGRPCWVLLHDVPDWRWGLGRPDSPWYDSMRLFRQAQRGAWTPVLQQVAQALLDTPRAAGSGLGLMG